MIRPREGGNGLTKGDWEGKDVFESFFFVEKEMCPVFIDLRDDMTWQRLLFLARYNGISYPHSVSLHGDRVLPRL